MGPAERADLVARLTLDDKLSGQSAKAASNFSRSMGKMAATAKKGVSTAATNIARIGVVAAAGVGAAVKSGISSLVELESATTSVDAAIKQMGLTGQVTSSQIAGWANDIERNVGAAFDDKAITAAATNLIRYGKVSVQNIRPAMEVMTDLAAKTGDVESASSLLAKALADPTKATRLLKTVGVTLTDQQDAYIKKLIKQGKLGQAQAAILRLVAERTKGAAAATQGPMARAQSVLADTMEDATRALATGFLPVLMEVQQILTEEMGKPETLNRLREFGEGVAGGLRGLVSAARGVDWGAIGSGLKLAGEGAKTVYDMFTGMPDWVKTAVLTGWGLNKLTGGAVGDLVGQGLKLTFGNIFARGSSPGNPMYVAAVGGGVGGAAGGKGVLGTLGTVALAAASIAALSELISIRAAQSDANKEAGRNLVTKTGAFVETASEADMRSSLSGIDKKIAWLKDNPLTPEGIAYALNIDDVQTTLARTRQTIDTKLNAARDSIESARIAQVSGTDRIVAAIRASAAKVFVSVYPGRETTRITSGSTVNSRYAGKVIPI